MSKRFTKKGLVGASFLLAAGLAVAANRSSAVQPAIALSLVRPALIEVERPVASQMVVEPLPPDDVAIRLENVNGGDGVTLHITQGGHVRPEDSAALEEFFRCRRTGKHRPLDPGVLSMLVDVARRWPGKVIEIVSGFRAPPFGAPHSKHFVGHAIDLRVRGVRTTELRDFLWREHNGGVGVGYYAAENFVHMDWRPESRDTSWSELIEGTKPEYNPGWAWRARHPRPSRRHHVASARTGSTSTVALQHSDRASM
jgi:uncharacterized protein YcbK (DUF882 family)